ncbi:type II toxin-antitoxin system Phd/YefM family antitoxin [Cellulomonas sp. H30R-01]|uniref:Antitoxin n=1 Tax=Cellulomonas algicola TaxID=2071633 RepID=A0A401UY54_9CELL|nr:MULTISPECIES: type II toxin-antitoxin system prevent-host-death family antitoxin [Cellulomonas]QHT55030.1 type II toxin-antitoxin system Phd/YefM family antitoxin [Cellulomonas sp. H30R-01]GCD19460.1 antitoxin [Cellulomonas algicola]
MTTTMTSRQFNHDVSAAKRAASDGPVVITDRGVPSHVLLTIEQFDRLSAPTPRPSLADALRGDDAIEFEPGRVELSPRPVDL